MSEENKELEPQPNPTIDYAELYRQERQRREDLEATLAAARIKPMPSAPGADIRPKTFEQARAQVGPSRWSRMSNAERLVAMNQDPTQDLGFVRQLWGRGADPRISADLHKTNPLKYRQTREAALALGLFGQ
jgi:hypothetical protein